MKKRQKWKEYCKAHPGAASAAGMVLIIAAFFLAFCMPIRIGRHNIKMNAQKTLQENAQAYGLENIRTEIEKSEADGTIMLSLYADKPQSMNHEALYKAVRQIQVCAAGNRNWGIYGVYINGDACRAGEDALEWGGKTVYKTSKRKETQIASQKPYVGMDAEYIEKTSLGAADQKQVKTERIADGIQKVCTTYIWKNADGQTIFTALVESINGWSQKITQVKECSPQKSSDTQIKTNPSAEKPASDSYHSQKYTTAEDFYDDNYDNFFSYEDAETYYEKYK